MRVDRLRIINCAFLAAAIVVLAGHTKSEAQRFQPEEHPNHYIVVVDASGSTISNVSIRKLYHETLQGRLISLLFGSGFGDVIPRFDPGKDVLSLLNFGVVPQGAGAAYEAIKHYDLETSYIHFVINRERFVTQEKLSQVIVPTQYYQITSLVWVKQLALAKIVSAPSQYVSHRTFLILVHDYNFNNGNPDAEANLIKTKGKNVAWLDGALKTVSEGYVFTDGKDHTGKWAYQEKIPNENDPLLFIECYEVLPVGQIEWQKRTQDIKPFEQVGFEWSRESGDLPEGILYASINKELLSELAVPEDVTAFIKVEDGVDEQAYPWVLSSSLQLPVTVAGKLTCQEKPLKVSLKIPVSQKQTGLGARTINSIREQIVTAPPLAWCRWSFLLSITFFTIAALLITYGVFYCLRYRLFATHIQVEMPGELSRVRLGRNGFAEREPLIPPQDGGEAFTLHLPDRWLQKLFYGNAILEIQSNSDTTAYWTKKNGKLPILNLPTLHRRISARWNQAPANPTTLTLIFRQGKHKGRVVLCYSKRAVNQQEELNAPE